MPLLHRGDYSDGATQRAHVNGYSRRYYVRSGTGQPAKRKERLPTEQAKNYEESSDATVAATEARRRQRAVAAEPVRIVVVDDHRFMRELISAMLARQHGRYQVVAEHGNAHSAIRACADLSPDLLILDINLPDLSGIDAVPHIKKRAPKTRILLCTAFVTDDRVVDALRCGADGFVEKTNTWKDFIEAIERVTNGEHYFRAQSSPALARPLTSKRVPPANAPAIRLSPREQEVLTLIAHGNSSKEIAEKLGVGTGTVETHRCRMMRKLKLRNVAELVVYAFRIGLLKLPKTPEES